MIPLLEKGRKNPPQSPFRKGGVRGGKKGTSIIRPFGKGGEGGI